MSAKVFLNSTTVSSLKLLDAPDARSNINIESLLLSANGDSNIQFFNNDTNTPLTNIFYVGDHQNLTLNLRSFDFKASGALYCAITGNIAGTVSYNVTSR